LKKKCWLALLLWVSVVALAADAPDFTFSNPPGKYAVGFKVVDQYDYSRTYAGIDNLGQPAKGEVARPIQTLIWYPSEKTSKPHLTYGDYLALAATKDNFNPSAAAIDSAKQAADKLGNAKTSVMWAIRDAAPFGGIFPLVIYAPSFNAQSFENADLCEYLASHGYVVIASPSLGAHPTGMTGDVDGATEQARDISFLIGFAHTLPQADLSKVAVAGFSWGGISNLFAAARDNRIDALVSFDGSARYFPKVVHDSGDVRPSQMSLPVLFFTQGGMSLEDAAKHKLDVSGNVLNELKYCDLTIVRMHAMQHGDFSSFFERSPDHWKHRQAVDYSGEEAVASYGWVARYTLEFLDAVLKRDPEAVAFLKDTPVKNGVPNHLMAIERSPSQGTPASFDTFRTELGKQGFSHATEVYAKFKAQDADFKIDEGTIDGWGYALMGDKHLPEAIEVFKLNVSLYPDSGDVYDSLGEAYAKAGNKELAIANYKKSLEKDPSNDHAKEQLKILEAPPAKP